MRFLDSELYACGEEGGRVAGEVRFDLGESTISWFQPGGRQRAYEIAQITADTDDQLAFVDKLGRKFVLFPLTVDHYNKHIRQEGERIYPTKAALMHAFRQSLQT